MQILIPIFWHFLQSQWGCPFKQWLPNIDRAWWK